MEKEKPGKSGPLTQADLELLGYHKITPLQTTGQFRLFVARTRAGIGEAAHAFVYPLTTAQEHDISQVEKMVAANVLGRDQGVSETYVVIPKGLQIRPKPGQGNLVVYEDLMWEKIQADFSEYMEEFQQSTETLLRGVSYVEPSFSDGKAEGVSPTEYLHSFLSGKEEEEGIVVVQGGAMFGKTTLAASVAGKLSQDWKRFRVVPVLLRGQTTWRDLAERSRDREIDNLWDMLSLALVLTGGPAHQGGEGLLLKKEELFRRIMQQGYVALIFDGFDELPKVRGARISPRDNFEWLSGVAANSSARILVTTRPTFWEREVGDAASRRPLDLAPFNESKAYQYFDKYFEAVPGNGEKAKNMYQNLLRGVPSGNEDNFVKLPACARMVADYVKNGGTVPLTGGRDQQSMLRGFLMEILERERQRQQISIRAEDLHRAFEEMAVSFNGEFARFDLECVLPQGIDGGDLDKIPDHAFIDSSAGKFRFRQDFLTHYLKACHVHRLLMESPNGRDIVEDFRNDGDLRDLINEESDGGGQLAERVSDFLDMEDLKKLGDVHSRINAPDGHPLKSFLFHVIAKTVVARMKDASRSDRAKSILLLLGGDVESGGGKVSNLFVQGEVSDISLGGWAIARSHFSNLRLAQCGTKGPHFIGCRFRGAFDWGSVKFGLENFEDCKPLDQEAQLWMSQITGHDTDEDIRNYMRSVLERFWAANNIRNIDSMRWKTGITRKIEERFDLLDTMRRADFIEEAMHGRRLKVKGDSIGYLRDFLENGAIRGSVRRIFDAMKKKAGRLGS